MQRFRAHHALQLRIKDANIRICAGSNRPFARIHAHDLGRISGNSIYESPQRKAALANHFRVHHCHARLHAGIAAGCVIHALALRFHRQRTAKFIGRNAGNGPIQRAGPKLILIRLGFQRWVGVIHLPIRPLIILARIEHVLMQRLTINRQALGAGIANGAHAIPGGHMHHIKRGARHMFCQAHDTTEGKVF